MQSEMRYIELKTGHSDDGPAWIARGVLEEFLAWTGQETPDTRLYGVVDL